MLTFTLLLLMKQGFLERDLAVFYWDSQMALSKVLFFWIPQVFCLVIVGGGLLFLQGNLLIFSRRIKTCCQCFWSLVGEGCWRESNQLSVNLSNSPVKFYVWHYLFVFAWYIEVQFNLFRRHIFSLLLEEGGDPGAALLLTLIFSWYSFSLSHITPPFALSENTWLFWFVSQLILLLASPTLSIQLFLGYYVIVSDLSGLQLLNFISLCSSVLFVFMGLYLNFVYHHFSRFVGGSIVFSPL